MSEPSRVLKHRAYSGNHGFSLLEVMVTITVAAVLIGLALPSFRELLTRNNVTSINNQLITALQIARSEAVRRGTWVEVTSVGGTASWGASGWSVIADADFNKKFDASDATAATVSKGAATPSGFTVCTKSTGPTGIGGDALVVFDPTGALTQSTLFEINVNRPDKKATLLQHITVSKSGEIKSQQGGATSAPTSC